VTESAGGNPLTEYEKTKWLVEQHAISATAKGLDVAILRPTAIVGPGGQNLVGLASSLLDGNPVANYFRASLFGRRAMHLVPVRNVAAAVLHLAGLPHPLGGNIYQVSADDEPGNDFRSIEAMLSKCLGVRPRAIPLLPLPPQMLALLLRLLGRSDSDPHRCYDSGKLLATGYRPVDSVPDAVGEFAAKFRQQRETALQPPAVNSLRP
jgi:nucleoside-diphosphate-sugar epimerase